MALILLVIGLTASPSLAATTNRPMAHVSMARQPEYISARPCAAGCLIYNGNLPCNAGSFWQDVGVHLGCGACGPVNNCYCSAKLGSSASEYLTACVSNSCATSVDSWEEEAQSMVSIYDAYCTTALVAAATTSASVRSRSSGAGAPAETGGSGSGSGSDGGQKGLSQSDIVAIATSLGVGVPSLIVAAITLWVQLRKRRARAEAQGAAPHPEKPTGGAPTFSQSSPTLHNEAFAVPLLNERPVAMTPPPEQRWVGHELPGQPRQQTGTPVSFTEERWRYEMPGQQQQYGGRSQVQQGWQ